MSIKGKANIVGIFEHPTRKADDKSLFQLHAECAQGALADAGLGKNDIDGYFCAAGDTPGLGALSMIDYLGLKLRHWDSTDTGGSSYLLQVGHAAEAIAAGKCSIALITLAGRPRTEGQATGTAPRPATVQIGRDRVREPLRASHREYVRDVRDAAHAPIRHDQRAARLGQGRGLAPCAIQPACDAARRGHGRGRGQFADDRRPAAPARLLRDQRWRRRDHRRQPRGGEEPEAAIGQDHRRRRGAKAPDGRRRST